MIWKTHLPIAGLYGGVFLLPLTHPSLLRSRQIPILNFYYMWVFIWILLGSITPDFDKTNSFLARLYPTAANVLRGWFYEDEAERTGLKHRKISHRVDILIKVILFLLVIGIFAVTVTYFIQSLINTIVPALQPYSEPFDILYTLGLYLVGISVGIFTHLWLDSTTKQGIFGGKYTGYIFVGSYAEEYTSVLMIFPGIILVSLGLISIVFNNWMTVYLLSGTSVFLFVLLGILFRSRRFYELVIPTKTCPHCDRLWYIKKRENSDVNFWGHNDYKTGPCNKGEDIDSPPVDNFPQTTRVILQFYVRTKSFLKRKKEE